MVTYRHKRAALVEVHLHAAVVVRPSTSNPENLMNRTSLAPSARTPVGIISAALRLVDTTEKPLAAICVNVPDGPIDREVGMRILTGSTMNGRVLTEGDADKLLDDMKSGAQHYTAKNGTGLHVANHREARRLVGLKRHGRHLALDD